MKKIYLLFVLLLAPLVNGQIVYTSTFTNFAETAWTQTNQSSAPGLNPLWQQGNPSTFLDYHGIGNGYASSNYNAVAGTGTISNWLISPTVELRNGDVITFYTRCASELVADRLEFRISTLGNATTVPSGGPNSVGSFTTLAVSVNPNLQLFTYPVEWTLHSYTVTGLSGNTSCKMAFRYYVTNGGLTGANSNYVGVDELDVYRSSLDAQSFDSKLNFSVYPNPTANILYIENTAGNTINELEIFDSSGRSVKTANGDGAERTQISVVDLASGIYYLKVSIAGETSISKIIRK